MKLTQWLHKSINPVHVGVYRMRINFMGKIYSRWNGEYWCLWSNSIRGASMATERSNYIYSSFNVFWRGLAVKPSGKVK